MNQSSGSFFKNPFCEHIENALMLDCGEDTPRLIFEWKYNLKF